MSAISRLRTASAATLLALCGQSALAATSTVFLSTGDFQGDSGANPSVGYGDSERHGTASVDGSAGTLRGSVVSDPNQQGSWNVRSVSQVSETYNVGGAGIGSLNIFALLTGNWFDGNELATARLQANLSLSGGGPGGFDSDRFGFGTPPGTTAQGGSFNYLLSATINVAAGSQVVLSGGLDIFASGSCTVVKRCGSAQLDASRSMTFFLGNLTSGLTLTQAGGDRFDLQTTPPPAAAIPLPAGLPLLTVAAAMLAPAGRRRRAT